MNFSVTSNYQECDAKTDINKNNLFTQVLQHKTKASIQTFMEEIIRF